MRVDEVQLFLRNVAEGRSLLGEKTWDVDRADLRAHFIERLETSGSWWMAVHHARWSDELDGLAQSLERLPLEHLRGRTQAFARSVVDAAVSGPDTGSIEGLEAARVLQLSLGAGVLTRRYCEEVRFLRPSGKGLTALGQALISLGAVDALKWLLVVETEQSTGAKDDGWRVSRDVLEELLNDRTSDFDPRIGWSFSHRTFARLAGFGLVAAFIDDEEGDGEPHRIDVRPALREAVRSALGDSSWQSAVRAALADERVSVLPGMRGSAIEAAQEQVRLVTHEVRNALVPARHQLEALLRTQTLEPQRLSKALDGVTRTLTFVDEMVATAEMMAPRPTVIGVEALMKRALANIDGAERIAQVPTPGVMRVTVDRIVHALANVLTNALQAPQVTHVKFSAHRDASTVTLAIDDDGTGVAPELRERIFHDGFTTKADGSGFGLAFARRVIEDNGGSIRCERSDLGGARFVITLPLVESSP